MERRTSIARGYGIYYDPTDTAALLVSHREMYSRSFQRLWILAGAPRFPR
jgi:hypothetical protein